MAERDVLTLEQARQKVAEIIDSIKVCAPTEFVNKDGKTLDVIASSNGEVFNEKEMLEVYRLKDLYKPFFYRPDGSEVRIPEEEDALPILFIKRENVWFKVPYKRD